MDVIIFDRVLIVQEKDNIILVLTLVEGEHVLVLLLLFLPFLLQHHQATVILLAIGQ